MSLTMSVVYAADAVNKALAPLEKDERQRVLLAAAVLYGIITPGESPEPAAITPVGLESARVASPRRSSGESIQRRVARQLELDGSATAPYLAQTIGANLKSVRAALSKLSASGGVRRVGPNVYEHVEST